MGGGIERHGVLSDHQLHPGGQHADGVGGAISAVGGDSDVTANAITVVRNSADDAGGGLYYALGAIGFEIANSLWR